MFKWFRKLTAERRRLQDRVAIAKDVIAQIEREIYFPAKGRYVKSIDPLHLPDRAENRDMQEVLINNPTCRVCALGGLLCSTIRKYNNFPVKNWNNDYSYTDFPVDYLLKYFTRIELAEIECAFECHSTGLSNFYDPSLMSDACKYGCSLSPNTNERLIQIMQNIIDNGGRFVIPRSSNNSEPDSSTNG